VFLGFEHPEAQEINRQPQNSTKVLHQENMERMRGMGFPVEESERAQ
jgi:hypothetical protein